MTSGTWQAQQISGTERPGALTADEEGLSIRAPLDVAHFRMMIAVRTHKSSIAELFSEPAADFIVAFDSIQLLLLLQLVNLPPFLFMFGQQLSLAFPV